MSAAFDLETEVLHTGRLDLLPFSLEFCRAVVAGDRALASRLLGYELGQWPGDDELRMAFPRYVQLLEHDPAVAGWHGRAIVVRGERIVAGSVNLKGRPVRGRAEVGYTLIESHRRRGYAREAASAAVARAFADPATTEVVAMIDPANAPSIHVAESLGMRATGEASAVHPGSLTWVVRRDDWERRP